MNIRLFFRALRILANQTALWSWSVCQPPNFTSTSTYCVWTARLACLARRRFQQDEGLSRGLLRALWNVKLRKGLLEALIESLECCVLFSSQKYRFNFMRKPFLQKFDINVWTCGYISISNKLVPVTTARNQQIFHQCIEGKSFCSELNWQNVKTDYTVLNCTVLYCIYSSTEKCNNNDSWRRNIFDKIY